MSTPPSRSAITLPIPEEARCERASASQSTSASGNTPSDSTKAGHLDEATSSRRRGDERVLRFASGATRRAVERRRRLWARSGAGVALRDGLREHAARYDGRCRTWGSRRTTRRRRRRSARRGASWRRRAGAAGHRRQPCQGYTAVVRPHRPAEGVRVQRRRLSGNRVLLRRERPLLHAARPGRATLRSTRRARHGSRSTPRASRLFGAAEQFLTCAATRHKTVFNEIVRSARGRAPTATPTSPRRRRQRSARCDARRRLRAGGLVRAASGVPIKFERERRPSRASRARGGEHRRVANAHARRRRARTTRRARAARDASVARARVARRAGRAKSSTARRASVFCGSNACSVAAATPPSAGRRVAETSHERRREDHARHGAARRAFRWAGPARARARGRGDDPAPPPGERRRWRAARAPGETCQARGRRASARSLRSSSADVYSACVDVTRCAVTAPRSRPGNARAPRARG